jgi:predicted CopG family antitoxin
VNEKTTIYLEPKLKEEVRIKLIREKDNKSLSALINELLEKWLKNT